MNNEKEPGLWRSGRNSFQEKGAAATKVLRWKQVRPVQRRERRPGAGEGCLRGRHGGNKVREVGRGLVMWALQAK